MARTGDRLNVVSVPPGAAFLDCLAERLIDGTLLSGPLARPMPPAGLADATVLLPNRRAARVLAERLVFLNGSPLILPRIAAIGDVDEDAELIREIAAGTPAADFSTRGELPLPPAVSALERHLALTRLVYEFGKQKAAALNYPGRSDGLLIPIGAADASALARDLARLLDAMQSEEIDPDRLTGLVPDNHAAYWDIAHRFVSIVVDNWPQHLAEQGKTDPIARRGALIRAEAARLAADRPEAPFIVAGSTGSVPATAALMKAVAGLPRGWVVLPGLDTALDNPSFDAAGEAQTHPQFGLARLCRALGLERADIGTLLPGEDAQVPARTHLVSEIFRPAETSEQWHERSEGHLAKAAGGLAVITADSPREEALAIALALREAVEDGAPDAALVTPDRGLARRVSAELARWGLNVDDSAGVPLSATSAGTFARAILEAAAENLAPLPLTALIRHALFRGPGGADMTQGGDALEALVLRGPRPAPGIAGLKQALAASLAGQAPRNGVAARMHARHGAAAQDLVAHLEAALSPLLALKGPARFIATAGLATDAAIALSGGTDENGAPMLFAGEDGARLGQFLDQVADCFDPGMDLPLASVPPFIASLMDAVPVRGHARDTRIAILGPLEARLQRFGRVVLGGLNEGTWPADAKTDPWLSRTMRSELGLDLPERRIGLAAHDVAQHLCGPDVVLTRARRADGAPTVASRWLQRLEAVTGAQTFAVLNQRGQRYLGWARALDHAEQDDPPAEPAPRPGTAHRPRRLSVTRAETLVRDPYAVYGAEVLGLAPLPPLDEDADAALRGSLVHAALAKFVAGCPTPLPGDAAASLTAQFEAEMDAAGVAAHTRALWRPRLARIAAWFCGYEAARRQAGHAVAALETGGRLAFDAPGGTFTLTARADRIDITAGGTLAILDYKTGTPPSAKEVAAGLAPQLTLEGAIAAAGGFAGVTATPPSALVYLQLSGGNEAGKEMRVSDDAAETTALCADALAGFKRLIAAYDTPAMAYRPRVAAQRARDDLPFDHLSRYREWSTAESGEDGA